MKLTLDSWRAPVRHLMLAVSAVLLWSLTTPAAAVDIQAEFDANVTAAQRQVINAKLELWEGRLPHQSPEHVVKISFKNADLGTLLLKAYPDVEITIGLGFSKDIERLTLAEASDFKEDADGRPTSAKITINNNAAVPWYVSTDPNVPADKYDFYTVMNHEIAHALGFTVNNSRFRRNVTVNPDPNDPNTPGDPNTGGRTYEGGGPGNTPTGTLTPRNNGTHTDPNAHPDDLMNPGLPKGVRRTPSDLDVGILNDDVWKYPAIKGTLSNFDVWNRSGNQANDFMVTLGGIDGENIAEIYNGFFCPWPDGRVEPSTGGTSVKWGPGDTIIGPGQQAHFGFKINGGKTPTSYKFEWTFNNAVVSTVKVTPASWRTLTEEPSRGPMVLGGVRNRITNETDTPFWVFRRANISPMPVILDDLLLGMPLDATAWPVDPAPILLLPNQSIVHDFYALPPDVKAVVMIVDYFEDIGGPGAPLGTWLDAAEVDFRLVGDMNCDGIVDVFDINPFVQAILDPAGYMAAFPFCDIMNGDINDDGIVDVFDINPFVDLILAP